MRRRQACRSVLCAAGIEKIPVLEKVARQRARDQTQETTSVFEPPVTFEQKSLGRFINGSCCGCIDCHFRWLARRRPRMTLSLLFAAIGLNTGNVKFDRMLSSVALSSAEVACIENPRVRMLLGGVGAVQEAPSVLRAFQIIYEDMPILRPAGDFAVRKLSSKCKGGQERAAKIELVLGSTSEADTLPRLRQYFDSIDSSGDGYLSSEELVASCAGAGGKGAAALARVCLDALCDDDDECDEMITDASEAGSGITSFEDFVVRVSNGAVDVAAFVEQLDDAECDVDADGAGGADAKRREFEHEFDSMIATARQWEAASEGYVSGYLQAGDRSRQRLGEVLRGVFDGARNPPLIKALRVVYCDSQALRAAGNIVFGLMSKLVSAISKDAQARPAAEVVARAAPADAGASDDDEQPLPPRVHAAEISAEVAPSPNGEVGEEPCELTVVATKVTVADDWKAAMAYLREDAFGGD